MADGGIVSLTEEAERLALELAAATGEEPSRALVVALRERLERIRGERRVDPERLAGLGRAIARQLDARTRSLDHGELLYDERGLPR